MRPFLLFFAPDVVHRIQTGHVVMGTSFLHSGRSGHRVSGDTTRLGAGTRCAAGLPRNKRGQIHRRQLPPFGCTYPIPNSNRNDGAFTSDSRVWKGRYEIAEPRLPGHS
jgi:hypothetical protein